MRIFLSLLLLAACSNAKTNLPTAKPQKPAPFTPPPLASLPDVGVIKTVPLKKRAFKKICPAPKKNSKESVACLCVEIFDESGSSITDDPNSCLKPTITLVDSFFAGMGLLAKAEASSAEFSLFIRSGEERFFYTQIVGSASMEPDFGYATTYKIKNLDFVKLSGASLVIVLVHRTHIDVTAEKPTENKRSDGSITVCHAQDRVSCSAQLSLGSSRGEGYELTYILEDLNLYLVETSAKTDPELKKTVGKYTIQFP